MYSPLVLFTEQATVTLRQLTPEDASAYFEAVDSNREHLSQFGDETASKYPDLQSVEESIINPSNPHKLRLGIWDKDAFVGSINLTPEDENTEAEIGYWLDGRFTGRGYATLATSALAQYARSRFSRIHADVVKGNNASAKVLERSGFTTHAEKDGKTIFTLVGTKLSQTEINIDSAVPEDLNVLIDFMLPVYADTYPNERGIKREMFENDIFHDHLNEYLYKKLADSDSSLLIARDGDQVIGTIGLETSKDSLEAAEVWGFYVTPELQSTGYGQILWSSLMEKLDPSIQILTLTVAKDSTKAKSFYEHNGFIVVGEEQWNWPNWTDERLQNQYWKMQKYISN